MKTFRAILIVIVLAGVAVGAYVKYVDVPVQPQILETAVTRGDIVMTVSATGTLQATRTVDIGTQVTGVVAKMYVDYNSIVKKNELIAEIDPALSQAALDSSKAAFDKAEIDLGQAQATLVLDTANRDREEALFGRDLVTEQDKETAELQVKEDQAMIDQDKAAAVIAHAGVEQAQVTLDFCTIRSPIDGVVVQRNADVGQTVTSSLTVPSLYVLATDITNLELSGQVDESDIGKLHPGQDVAFTVDAYPGQTFHGAMTHVRLYATTVNNVVTYQAIVAVPNQDLRLLPSMTANMKVDVGRASNVVRVPNAALRFKPSHEMLAAVGEAPALADPASGGAGPGGHPLAPPPALPVPVQMPDSSSTTPMIDTMFTAQPHPQSSANVWVMDAGHLQRMPITIGLTDGTWTELLAGDLSAGQTLVSAVILPVKIGGTPSGASPLMPAPRGGTPPRPPGR